MEPVGVEPPEVVQEAEGQNKPLKKTENLLEIVKKLQKEGSLEPQIKDLIMCINDIQQAKKSGEGQQEAQALGEALRLELDSLNEEKAHLEEVLRKKKATLSTLQLHCQRRSTAQRVPGEELRCLKSQHKELWEFHVMRSRLTAEVSELQGSLEQLLTEEGLARAKLQEVEQRLRSPPTVGEPLTVVKSTHTGNAGLKTGLEILGARVQAPAQSPSENRAGQREAQPELPGDCTEEERKKGEEELAEEEEKEEDGVEARAELSLEPR